MTVDGVCAFCGDEPLIVINGVAVCRAHVERVVALDMDLTGAFGGKPIPAEHVDELAALVAVMLDDAIAAGWFSDEGIEVIDEEGDDEP